MSDMRVFGVRSIAQPMYIYNVCSVGNKPEDQEAIVQQNSYDMVAILETCWDGTHGCL